MQISNEFGCSINRRIDLLKGRATFNPVQDSIALCFNDVERSIRFVSAPISHDFELELISGPQGATIDDFMFIGLNLTAKKGITAGTYVVRVLGQGDTRLSCPTSYDLTFIIHPAPDLTINPVASLCLSDDAAMLTLANPPSGGFGGFCANPLCPQRIAIYMDGELEVDLMFESVDQRDRFLEKIEHFTVALDNGGTVEFWHDFNPNAVTVRFSSGLTVGQDIAMEFLPTISGRSQRHRLWRGF